LGGLIASNPSGPRRAYYGGMRDLVLGLKAIKGDGAEIKTGGKTVKNVAGYDLSKLFVGSYGTLGIITEATLKLHAIPEVRRWNIAGYENIGHCLSAADQIMNSRIMPNAFNLLHFPQGTEVLGGTSGGRFLLELLFEGKKESVRGLSAGTEDIFKSSGAKRRTLDEKNGISLDKSLDAEFMGASEVLALKVTVPPARVAPVVESLCSDPSWAENNIRAFYAAGVIQILHPCKKGDEEVIAHKVRELRGKIRSLNGSLVVEKLPKNLQGSVEIWGEEIAHMDIMRAIKREFDPYAIFVSGRFVGGI
jgi:glycolate oxidase FAD binding subunit